jgi:hypothetical protein
MQLRLVGTFSMLQQVLFFLQREEYTLAARHPRGVNVSAVLVLRSRLRELQACF